MRPFKPASSFAGEFFVIYILIFVFLSFDPYKGLILILFPAGK